MKKIKWTFLLLLLTSCVKKIDSGVVVEKEYREKSQETYMEYDIIFKMPLMKTRYISQKYILTLKGFNGEDTIRQRFFVKKEIWENTEIGDIIKLND
jgi:hypothetical protein